MTNIQEHIRKLTALYYEEVVMWYRYLHQHPELSFNEYNTANFISNQLGQIGIEHKTGVGGHGVVGIIKGSKPGRVIALRAEMDALAINEETQLDYASVNKDVMHACGHDAHAASLLGIAKILFMLRTKFKGTVMLIFQPAEERFPGGAKLMMEDGLFKELQPDLILGQHVMPGMPVGNFGIRPGIVMASADEINITIRGKGGHGALVYQHDDPVLTASHVLIALQQMISRKTPTTVPSVLSFGRFIANGTNNTIPNEVTISGTLRTLNESWRANAKELIKTTSENVAKAFNCACKIDIKHGYPAVVNDEDRVWWAGIKLRKIFSKEQVQVMDVRMTSEDFGYFAEKYPAVFFRFGCDGKGNQGAGGLHSSEFCIDESALMFSVEGMAQLAMDYLTV